MEPLGDVEGLGQGRPAEVIALGAEVHIIVFDLGRPVARGPRHPKLEPGTQHPSPSAIRDGRGEWGERVADFEVVMCIGAAALDVDQALIIHDRQAQAGGKSPNRVHLGAAVEVSTAAIALTLEVGPAELDLDTCHPGRNKCKIIADLATAEYAVDRMRAIKLIPAPFARLEKIPFLGAPACAHVGADIETGPAEWHRR